MDHCTRAGDRARRSRHHQDHSEGRRSGIRIHRGLTLESKGKIVLASQHYPPDPSTTAAIMVEIACRPVACREVVVLWGSPGALPAAQTVAGNPRAVAITNKIAGKPAPLRARRLGVAAGSAQVPGVNKGAEATCSPSPHGSCCLTPWRRRQGSECSFGVDYARPV